MERLIAKIREQQQWYAKFNLGDHALLRDQGSPFRWSTEEDMG